MNKLLVRCTCDHTRVGLLLAPPATYTLRGGDQATFVLYRCEVCGALAGRPDSHLELALERGTMHTLWRLCELAKLH